MHSISHMLRFRDRGGQAYRIEFVAGLDRLEDSEEENSFWHIIREEAMHGDVVVELNDDPGVILSAAQSLQLGTFVDGLDADTEDWDVSKYPIVYGDADNWNDEDDTDELPKK